eukprot:CAMPEP_0202441804 /NCGR_PEP_ID=MMETSP1360-20130828/1314_1 /ASSEMBLY_ACC=CAM_ASM_000848 /TAXON_ID=515479 /ORGANISM="Licmophora paradoxa, Strain CCMP2313" /LENGTH=573 /DNA_ID=CAMNT_0049056955 /DNA_START=51 /DNA_END=1772 /DNA_ORIENTATION=+
MRNFCLLTTILLILPLIVSSSSVEAQLNTEGHSSDRYGENDYIGISRRGRSMKLYGGNTADSSYSYDVWSMPGGSTTRIVGGQQAPSGRYPYFVHLEIITNAGRFQCGGTLIYEDIVVTAAHCLVDRSNEGQTITGIEAWVGLEDITRKDLAIFRTALNAVPNTGYDGFLNNDDIMVLKLNAPVTTVTPVLLNFAPEAPAVGTPVKIFGMGSLQEGGQFSNTLQDATVGVIDFNTCNSPNSYNGTIVDAVMICAGVATGSPDSCLGDSGSALIVETIPGNPAGDVQVGITSFGNGCARPGFPGGYTRISAYQQFLVSNVCALANSPPDGCTVTPIPTVPPPTPFPVVQPTPFPVVQPTPFPVAQPVQPAPFVQPTPFPVTQPTPFVQPTPFIQPTPFPVAPTGSCGNVDGSGFNPTHCSCVGNCGYTHGKGGKGGKGKGGKGGKGDDYFYYYNNFGKGKGGSNNYYGGNNNYYGGKGKGGKRGTGGHQIQFFNQAGKGGGKGGKRGGGGKGGGKRSGVRSFQIDTLDEGVIEGEGKNNDNDTEELVNQFMESQHQQQPRDVQREDDEGDVRRL